MNNNMMNNNMMNNMMNGNQNGNGAGSLLRRIQAEDFALYEAVLYLDAYPTNQKALAFYREHRKILDALKEEYRQKYGPLTIYDNIDSGEWDWVKGPWPWEREAN
ncbi:MAG: spore coat protein CotJB [Clostridia bacterium]|nr:spore coat protein CotJB [Clostridia bacterium]